MNKNILLAAAALSVLATAGAANAASITIRTGAANTVSAAPYTLARELNYSAGIKSTAGQFDTVLTANQALAAGTYTINVSYSGATLNAGVSSAAIAATAGCVAGEDAGFVTQSGAGATMTLSAGGSAGSNSVSYTLQVPQGSTVTSVCFSPALNVTGPVSVTASIINQVTGQPVDPSVIQSVITNTTQGFAAAAVRDTTVTAIIAAAANAPANAPKFRTLSADTTIGTISYAAATTVGALNAITGATADSAIAYKDLNGTAVATTDVTAGNFTVNGDFTGLTVSAGGTALTKSGNSAAATLAGPVAQSTAITLAPVGGANQPQINPSAYSVSGSFSLGTAFAAPLTLSSTALETVSTEGLTYVIPWVSSRTQGASTGSRTVIRISRIGSTVVNGGNVYAQVLNPIRGSAAGNWALVGTLGASGEVVMSSDTLETAFGDFGRADIRLALTPNNGAGFSNSFEPLDANNIVVKRVISQPNGGVSEMSVVAVGANTPSDVSTAFPAPAAP